MDQGFAQTSDCERTWAARSLLVILVAQTAFKTASKGKYQLKTR